MKHTLEINHLYKNFGSLKAIENVSFKTQNGEIIALLGPNGAGKSTLMNMLTGYLSPSSGQIKIMGRDIINDTIFAKQNIGFLPEGSPLYPDMSVTCFLNYMAELRGFYGKSRNQRIAEVAAIANIKEVLSQKIETLSKGYLRRVGFAQSILSDPDILLLDEPTDGLDPNQKAHMRQLISSMKNQKTIIISTHLLEEAESIATRIILINHGRIIIDGTMQDILFKAQAPDLAQAFAVLTQENQCHA